MDKFDWTPNLRPGFRLKKLEVTNWGTFDSSTGQVHRLDLDGQNALLVGQNGSGKSTLVDTLLTLLVQPGVRNYNVAAGAKKRERDERTYIRGACGRTSSEERGTVTEFLRPDDRHYSVLLACFERAKTSEAFTVVQVLQITGDGEVDKTYAYAEEEKSIAEHVSGLRRDEKIRKQLLARGFKATNKYSEYMPWVTRKTNMRPKALDVFNQTVAVKDIQSLNRFIREHMLEAKPWRERIDNLLTHFTQLSQAHQSLVRARRQVELLEPIAAAGEKLEKLQSEHVLLQQQLDAIDSFFRQQSVDRLKPQINGSSQSLAEARQRKLELDSELEALDDQARRLKNEIESTGGQRLKQLPLQLETQSALLASKKRERNRLVSALRSLGVDVAINDQSDFQALHSQLEQVQSRLTAESTAVAKQRLDLARELSSVRQGIEEDQSQLESVERQSGNLPSWLADIREALVSQTGIAQADLPFVCELVSVAEEEKDWQPAIESVLRPFALTMLVPDRHYRLVSEFVETQRLVDRRGRGQKLAYARIPKELDVQESPRLHRDSLVHKLRIKQDHELHQWLRSQLSKRFDFRCCDSIDQFQRAPRLAITQSRHLKYGNQHHEKDDRPRASDANQFVLGWDNAERLQHLRTKLTQQRKAETDVLDRIHASEQDSKRVSKQLTALEVAQSVDDFDLVDIGKPEKRIEQLEAERRAIEDSNDTVKALREQLDAVQTQRTQAQVERDQAVSDEGTLLRDSDYASHQLDKHERILQERATQGELATHHLMFESLEQAFGKQLERVTDLLDLGEVQTDASRELQHELNQITAKVDPLRDDIIRSMQKFLSDSPEEKDDLRADLDYLSGFLGLLHQLRQDDLPRYERRFQDRLNEKVIQELGVFHAALQCEKQEIADKIETLNASLKQLEYRPGTFMRLEPRNVSDLEVRDFQTLLRDCLDDQFDDDEQANEARFRRIEMLIQRLRDEDRWREKVTDVRRWYDFAALELDVISGAERSCYADSAGQSGGEKAKLAFTILVAAIAYQFDIDPANEDDDRFHFVVVDEMFSKVDDRYAEYALELFEKFGLQLLIVAPLDAKARVTEPFVGRYLHTVKNEQSRTSQVITLTAEDYAKAIGGRTPPADSEDADFDPHALAGPKPK